MRLRDLDLPDMASLLQKEMQTILHSVIRSGGGGTRAIQKHPDMASLPQTANCQLSTVNRKQPTDNCQQPTAHLPDPPVVPLLEVSALAPHINDLGHLRMRLHGGMHRGAWGGIQESMRVLMFAWMHVNGIGIARMVRCAGGMLTCSMGAWALSIAPFPLHFTSFTLLSSQVTWLCRQSLHLSPLPFLPLSHLFSPAGAVGLPGN